MFIYYNNFWQNFNAEDYINRLFSDIFTVKVEAAKNIDEAHILCESVCGSSPYLRKIGACLFFFQQKIISAQVQLTPINIHVYFLGALVTKIILNFPFFCKLYKI